MRWQQTSSARSTYFCGGLLREFDAAVAEKKMMDEQVISTVFDLDVRVAIVGTGPRERRSTTLSR